MTDATLAPVKKIPMHQPIEVPWRITKARTRDGVMEWEATTSKFSRDQQGDLVTRGFYQTAIQRFKSKTTPPPFFSVAHYQFQSVCDCGAVFKSLEEHKCSACGQDRLLAGITTDMWIDGKQPKARGVFFDNELGRAVYKSCRDDIEKSVPADERVRVSMGFYPDPGGVRIPAPGQRDFITGWVEHFAGTRVPVVPEATLEAKSLNIKTKYEDAAAIVPKHLADRMDSLTRTFKSQAPSGRIDKSTEETSDRQTSSENKSGSDDRKQAKDAQDQTEEEDQLDDQMSGVVAELENMQEFEEVSKSLISAIDDPVMREAFEAQVQVMKAIVTPGTDKTKILALAAELVSAIRDYAHTLTGTGVPTATMTTVNGEQIPVDPNQQQPANQPVTPSGRMFDETTADKAPVTEEEDLLNEEGEDLPEEGELAPEAGDFVTPTEDEAVESDLEDTEEALEETDVEEEDVETGDEVPPVPMPDEYKEMADEEEAAGEEEVIPDEEAEEEETEIPLPEEDVEEEEASAEEEPAVEEEEEEVVEEDEEEKPKKKLVFKKKKETPVGKSVTGRTQPNAAVKSAAKHPAEAFVSSHAARLSQIAMGQLTKAEKKSKIHETLTEMLEGLSTIVEKSTPPSESDVRAEVEQAVEKALAQVRAENAAQLTQLQATIEGLTRTIVNGQVQEVIKSTGGAGPVRRRSFAHVTPTVTAQPDAGLPILSGSQVEIRKSTAHEIAAASVQAGSPLMRY